MHFRQAAGRAQIAETQFATAQFANQGKDRFVAQEEYSQDHRLIAVDTPLGKDVLLLQELTGIEGISSLFTYELNLLAYENDSIVFKDIVGQKVTITFIFPTARRATSTAT
jgi:uncharacterized protein involved in type VI secretion and phage assembly